MTKTEEIIAERDRIKQIVVNKIEAVRGWRSKWSSLRIKKRDLITIFNKLQDDICFLIDNPDYKNKGS